MARTKDEEKPKKRKEPTKQKASDWLVAKGRKHVDVAKEVAKVDVDVKPALLKLHHVTDAEYQGAGGKLLKG